MNRRLLFLLVAPALFALGVFGIGGCVSHPPLPTVPKVDLERFMGDWFVVAHIPASSEKNAYNGVESYSLTPDGKIATTYVFREGGFDGELEVMKPNAVVRDPVTNATWGMQFFWPLRFEYLITHLESDYSTTIIGRSARDYAWIMSREPKLSEERIAALVAILGSQGYDTAKVRVVPQRWPDEELLNALSE